MSKIGLVLSGGGARGAYQAGVLSAVAEISKELGRESPFQVYTGLSSGAINTGFLASNPTGFIPGCQRLVELWGQITSRDVFISDIFSLSRLGMNWMSELSLGGIKKHTPGLSLLDTQPLRDFIKVNCDFEQIKANLAAGHFESVAISAMNYQNTNTVTFVQSSQNLDPWARTRQRSEFTEIRAEHILASSAIPLLFPPVQVNHGYFGDGCIRNSSPCAPAIHMGVDRLLTIGVRKRQEICYVAPPVAENPEAPSAGRMINILLHAILSDGMELDIERIERINLSLKRLPPSDRSKLGLRHLDYLWLSPSKDLSEIALKRAPQLPRMIRYLIKGLGSLNEVSELISFLLFEPSYCEELVELGYKDGQDRREEILRFLDPSQNLVESAELLKHT